MILRVPGDVGPPPPRPTPPSCPHPLCEVRKQVRRTGSKVVPHAVWQCLACGLSVPKGGLKGLSSACRWALPNFDEAFRVERAMERDRAWREASAAHDAAWWEWYGRYLHSPRWKAKRAAVLERDRGRCRAEGCAAPAASVHHLDYTRVGDEDLGDLVAVCDRCHDLCHPNRTTRSRDVPGGVS